VSLEVGQHRLLVPTRCDHRHAEGCACDVGIKYCQKQQLPFSLVQALDIQDNSVRYMQCSMSTVKTNHQPAKNNMGIM
jgi:hypothetical protein